jgi:hypothetical protein
MVPRNQFTVRASLTFILRLPRLPNLSNLGLSSMNRHLHPKLEFRREGHKSSRDREQGRWGRRDPPMQPAGYRGPGKVAQGTSAEPSPRDSPAGLRQAPLARVAGHSGCHLRGPTKVSTRLRLHERHGLLLLRESACGMRTESLYRRTSLRSYRKSGGSCAGAARFPQSPSAALIRGTPIPRRA